MKFRHLVSQKEKRRTLPLYEASFPEDCGDYAEYYYQWKCKDNEVLVLTALNSMQNPSNSTQNQDQEANEVICAMLHLNPYRMWISTQSVILHYIVAVATALPYRRQGCMRRLMEEAFLWIYQQEEPFTYLMPADTIYYEPFGFRVIYDQTPFPFPDEIEIANKQAREQFDVVTLRDENYLQFLEAEPKLEEDFKTEPVLKERQAAKENHASEETSHEKEGWKPQIMGRIIHAKRLLECLRADRSLKIYLFIQDSLILDNTGWYCWQIDEYTSNVQRIESCPPEIVPDMPPVRQNHETISCLRICIEELTEQLFGIVPLHPSLSHLKILKRICINEEV